MAYSIPRFRRIDTWKQILPQPKHPPVFRVVVTSLGIAYEVPLHPTDWGGGEVRVPDSDTARSQIAAVRNLIGLLLTTISLKPKYIGKFWPNPIEAEINWGMLNQLWFCDLPLLLDELEGIAEYPCRVPADIYEDIFPLDKDRLALIKRKSELDEEFHRFAFPSAIIGNAYWLRMSSPGQYSLLKQVLNCLIPLADKHMIQLKAYHEGSIPPRLVQTIGADIETLHRKWDLVCPCAPNTGSVQFMAEFLMNWWSRKQKLPAYLLLDAKERPKLTKALEMLFGREASNNAQVCIIDYRLLEGNLRTRTFVSSILLLENALEESAAALRFAVDSPVHSYGRFDKEMVLSPYESGSGSTTPTVLPDGKQYNDEKCWSHRDMIVKWLSLSNAIT